MLKLYITRHGETEWNIQKILQGRFDSPLTETGQACAVALGNALTSVHFDAVYSSSSKRALDTAHLICKGRQFNIVADDELMEIDLGDWDGKTFDEVTTKDKEQFDCFWNTPEEYLPKRGESFYQVRDRVEQVLNKITSLHKNGNILIVTHATMVTTILMLANKKPLSELWKGTHIYGTSLSILDYTQGKFTPILEGDISHLKNITLSKSY